MESEQLRHALLIKSTSRDRHQLGVAPSTQVDTQSNTGLQFTILLFTARLENKNLTYAHHHDSSGRLARLVLWWPVALTLYVEQGTRAALTYRAQVTERSLIAIHDRVSHKSSMGQNTANS